MSVDKPIIRDTESMTPSTNPQCPHCQRTIRDGSTTCLYCGNNTSKAVPIMVGLFVAAMFGAVGLVWPPAYAGTLVGLLAAAAGWRYYPS